MHVSFFNFENSLGTCCSRNTSMSASIATQVSLSSFTRGAELWCSLVGTDNSDTWQTDIDNTTELRSSDNTFCQPMILALCYAFPPQRIKNWASALHSAASLVIIVETLQFSLILPFPTSAWVQCCQSTLNWHMNVFCYFHFQRWKEALTRYYKLLWWGFWSLHYISHLHI